MNLNAARVIIYHKHHTSARTVFLSINNTVCLFDGLPTLSSLLEESESSDDNVALHPGALVTAAEKRLGLESGDLEVDSEFQAEVDVPDGKMPIFLLRSTTIDPPREKVAELDGKFIAITEARGYAQTELLLLRRAYAVIMEG